MFQCLKCSTQLIPLQFLQAGNVETDQASPQTTLWVMRKHLDTVFVVWGEILLSLPSFGGRLTDRNSWEQQGGRGRERPIDCKLTREVHYTDRPETQHKSTYVLITSHESLPGTRSFLCFLPLWLFFLKLLSTVHFLGKSTKLNFNPSIFYKLFKGGKSYYFLVCTRQAVHFKDR